MAEILTKVRDLETVCDGNCCARNARFPNIAGSDCEFHVVGVNKDSDGKRYPGTESMGCALMRDESLCPPGMSKLSPTETNLEFFQRTCKNWPHNVPDRDTGEGCCWQKVDDGN